MKEKNAPFGKRPVELTDRSRTLSSYNIQDGSEFEFLFSLLPPSEKKIGGERDCRICSNSLSGPSVSYFETADTDGLKVVVGSCGHKVRVGVFMNCAYQIRILLSIVHTLKYMLTQLSILPKYEQFHLDCIKKHAANDTICPLFSLCCKKWSEDRVEVISNLLGQAMQNGDGSSMRIFISFVGGKRFHQSITLEVESTDTIGLLNDKIREQVVFNNNCHVLTYSGRELSDDGLTLGSYNIQNSSPLQMTLTGQYEISVQTLTGKKFTLMVSPQFTLLPVVVTLTGFNCASSGHFKNKRGFWR